MKCKRSRRNPARRSGPDSSRRGRPRARARNDQDFGSIDPSGSWLWSIETLPQVGDGLQLFLVARGGPVTSIVRLELLGGRQHRTASIHPRFHGKGTSQAFTVFRPMALASCREKGAGLSCLPPNESRTFDSERVETEETVLLKHCNCTTI